MTDHMRAVQGVNATSPYGAATPVERRSTLNAKLAAELTALAEQRTYTAWIFTGLGALATGIAINLMFAGLIPSWYGVTTGSALIIFSALCYIAAVWRSLQYRARSPVTEVRQAPAAMLIAVGAALIVIDLTILAAGWIAKP
jgi:putative membrane protein